MPRYQHDPDEDLEEEDESGEDLEEADADRGSASRKAHPGCAATIVLLALAGIGFFLRTWVFCRLWGWYMTPLFRLPELRYVQGLGLMLLAGIPIPVLGPARRAGTDLDELLEDPDLTGEEQFRIAGDIVKRAFRATLCPPLFVLAAAWIIKLFL
jgi:hypothetical protein